jgi:hypothetical protein
MSDSTFTDPKVVEMSKNFVNVIAHSETSHGDHEVLVGREKMKLCNDYYNIPCSTHTKGWSAVGKFFQGTFGTPSTVFADPTGKELSKHQGGMGSGELIKKMTEAVAQVPGDKAHLALWQAAKKLAADGDAFLAKGEIRKAVEAYGKLSRIKGAAFKTMSDAAAARAAEAGEKALEAALALENLEEKKKALRKIVDDYKPMAVSTKAKKELDALK